MSPDKNETPSQAELFPDLASEPQAYSMQWDLRELWEDGARSPTETDHRESASTRTDQS